MQTERQTHTVTIYIYIYTRIGKQNIQASICIQSDRHMDTHREADHNNQTHIPPQTNKLVIIHKTDTSSHLHRLANTHANTNQHTIIQTKNADAQPGGHNRIHIQRDARRHTHTHTIPAQHTQTNNKTRANIRAYIPTHTYKSPRI